jgi:SP family arabinose:H+ symporter-like MFS transporter
MNAREMQTPEALSQPKVIKAPPGEHDRRYVILIASIATFGGFLFGYDLSLMGGAINYLRDQFHLSEAAVGFTGGSATLGCMLGPFLGSWFCDRIGRERTLMAAALLLAVGALMTALAPNLTLFNIFRIVGGVGVGLCSIASPMYIAEVAPPKSRGRLGIMYQMAIVVGSTAAPLIAYAIIGRVPDSVCWRWMFGSQMVVVILFAGFLFLLPPSPRWLAGLGRFDKAAEVLLKVHGPEEAEREMREIKAALVEEAGGFGELLQPGIRYALFIGLLLAFFNNWTGWSAMGGYMPLVLEMAGVKSRQSQILQFTITYFAMSVITVASMFFIDRAGRRPLWIGASIAMAVITLITGLVFNAHMHGLVLLLVFILCALPHGFALGPLPWLMMSEIFPTRIRAKAVALTTTFLWLVIFTCAQLFPIFTGWSQRSIGSIAGVCWLFTLICVCSVIFGFKWLPETRGRTLEEIARALGNRAGAATGKNR